MPPQLGTKARRVRASEGQPAAARIEPGPGEVAEQERGERDDVIRRSMAEQAAEGGRNEGYLTGLGEQELSAIGESCLKLYRYLSGQFTYEHVVAGPVANSEEEQEVGRMKARAGKIFVVRRLSVLAPKGAKLRLYYNNIAAANFIEVVAAAQEFSGAIPGELRARENEFIVASVLGCKEAGTVTIHLEGDLVNAEPVPW
jgi:hypothetical protein